MDIDSGKIYELPDNHWLRKVPNRTAEARLAMLTQKEAEILGPLTPAERIAHPIRQKLAAQLQAQIAQKAS